MKLRLAVQDFSLACWCLESKGRHYCTEIQAYLPEDGGIYPIALSIADRNNGRSQCSAAVSNGYTAPLVPVCVHAAAPYLLELEAIAHWLKHGRGEVFRCEKRESFEIW